MHEAPALIDDTAIQQQFDRALAAGSEASLDFFHLLCDMDGHRSPDGQRLLQCAYLRDAGRAQGMRRHANFNLMTAAGFQRLHHQQNFIDIRCKTPLISAQAASR